MRRLYPIIYQGAKGMKAVKRRGYFVLKILPSTQRRNGVNEVIIFDVRIFGDDVRTTNWPRLKLHVFEKGEVGL